MIDVYYWPTTNGHKITMFLEETGLEFEKKTQAGITLRFRHVATGHLPFFERFARAFKLFCNLVRQHCLILRRDHLVAICSWKRTRGFRSDTDSVDSIRTMPVPAQTCETSASRGEIIVLPAKVCSQGWAAGRTARSQPTPKTDSRRRSRNRQQSDRERRNW